MPHILLRANGTLRFKATETTMERHRSSCDSYEQTLRIWPYWMYCGDDDNDDM